MGILRESWCFCNGGAKSEKLKCAIYSGKSPAMAKICSRGTGFFIHRNLLLTTHANLPSLAAAEAAEIRLHGGGAASLVPRRFFISSSVLDLTIVGIDVMDENTQLQPPHYIKTNSKPNLDLGSAVYLLGYAEKNELVAGEGKVVIATDNLIKLSTDGITWCPGSAGFDAHGNLAFMVCDPMKLATSPNTKSSSSSSSSTSRKKDHPSQFGIPIPVICDWLNQHWEGNLDDLNKPKMPLMRLVSSGHKADHSCASFTMRQVFKPTETEDEDTMTSRNQEPKLEELPGRNLASVDTLDNNHGASDPRLPTASPVQGISTSEIHELPKLRSMPVWGNTNTQLQLVDIKIPPRSAKSSDSLQAAIRILQSSSGNGAKESLLCPSQREERSSNGECPSPGADACSTNDAHSEVYSNSSTIAIPEFDDYYSSDGETTMYSAETAESRNYPSPKGGRLQYVGRSQSCLNHNRWQIPVQKSPVTRRTTLETPRNSVSGRKVYSQGATTQRSNDYFSPTVSSIMKKRNSAELLKPRMSAEQPSRVRPSAFPSSPRWIF